jgi:hypothetical protein
MRKTSAVLALVLAACGAKSAPPNASPTSPTPATASTPALELGEITAFDGPDAMLKIHADGSTEIGKRRTSRRATL